MEQCVFVALKYGGDALSGDSYWKEHRSYEERSEVFLRVAATNGLVEPRAGGTADDPRPSRAPFVSAKKDFETSQHHGFFRALARVFGGKLHEYRGRVVGCGVHLSGFCCSGRPWLDVFTRSVL